MNSLEVDVDKLQEILAPEGRLSTLLPQFESRSEQQEMLRLVAEAMNSNEITLIEAGTGTGKSLAYLLPAILHALQQGQRVTISTKTINLQQQLLEKDLPLCAKALGVRFRAALVKGMGNYLCLRKLEETEAEIELTSPEERDQLRVISAWARESKEGSRASLSMNPHPETWDKVSCEADTCSYRKCEHFERCYFFKARSEAENAQLLIANHHLLFADLALREKVENYEEVALLPPYRHLVLDEAHHLEDVATDFFGDRLSRTEMMRVMGRLASTRGGSAGGKIPLLAKKIERRISKQACDIVDTLLHPLRVELPLLRKRVIQAIADFFDALVLFIDQEGSEGSEYLRFTPEVAEKPFWGEEVRPAAEELMSLLKQYVYSIQKILQRIKEVDEEEWQEEIAPLRKEIDAYLKRLEGYLELTNRFCFQPIPENRVRWLEMRAKGTLQNVYLIEAQLDLSKLFSKALFSPFSSVHLCSATMATGKNFEYVRSRLGLTEEKRLRQAQFPSPFNYQKQALVVVPKEMPPPHDPQFESAAVEHIATAVETSRGGAFVLFTSYSQMRRVQRGVQEKLSGKRYTFFRQGEEQRSALLARFKLAKRAVLFGTDSFWEGVDVAGEALRLVVLVKLPFRVPSEPIFKARSEQLEKEGKDPFKEYALPQAIVKMKQGFGRLIRHRKDRGVVVILDSRILSKGYGKAFLESLPPCPKLFATGGEFRSALQNFFWRKK